MKPRLQTQTNSEIVSFPDGFSKPHSNIIKEPEGETLEMIEYEMHPLPTPHQKKKKFYGNYLKEMASANYIFKEWMDTLLSFIPMRVFLVDRSKSYYRFWQNSW